MAQVVEGRGPGSVPRRRVWDSEHGIGAAEEAGLGFFRRGESAGEPERIADSGGTAPLGQERPNGTGELFTSNLSVNEFALLRQLGPEPLAQVMGSSVVRVGWQCLPALPAAAAAPVLYSGYGPTATGAQLRNRYMEPSRSSVRDYVWRQELVCEMSALSDAWNIARRQALARLLAEAREVDGDAVVGVRLRRGSHDLGANTIDFVVTGTAISDPDRRRPGDPVLTDLSVQDYARLRRAGHEPVGLLASTVVVFASPSRSERLRRLRTTPQNQELQELSRGFHTARTELRRQLRSQLADAQGTGAVGVEISHTVRHETFPLASSLGSPERYGWNISRFKVPYYVSAHADTKRRGWVITMHGAGAAILYRQGAHTFTKTQISMGGT